MNLPAPLTPLECDLRGQPVPLHVFVELAMQQFGMSAADAEAMVRAVAANAGIPLDDVGHG